jgi:hypothetical protein
MWRSARISAVRAAIEAAVGVLEAVVTIAFALTLH